MRSAILARWIATAVVAIAASGSGCVMGGSSDLVFSSVEGENKKGNRDVPDREVEVLDLSEG